MPSRAKISGAATLSALLAALMLQLLLPGTGHAAPTAASVGPAERDAAENFWTPGRMRAAEPAERLLEQGRAGAAQRPASPTAAPTYVDPVAPGTAELPEMERGTPQRSATSAGRSEVADPAAPAFRAHGKVFFRVQGGSSPGKYVCSGTALASANRSLVWTAGHCVFDDLGGGYAKDWVFVPGYRDGAAPFGKWSARKLKATASWRKAANVKEDLGAAIVGPDEEGRRLVEVVGGQGVGFAQPRSQQYSAFGYPVSPRSEITMLPTIPEFDGKRLHRCDSPLGGTDNPSGHTGPSTMWIRCDMTQGASGGSWLARGRVLSVSAYKYARDSNRMYGPYHERAARKLYRSFAGKVPRCQDKRVTLLGTSGDDRLIGTPGRDVIMGGRGDDVIRGRGGNDVICGGPGDDRIHGGRGRDRIDGGPGRDRCDGGPGRDSPRRCAVTRRIR